MRIGIDARLINETGVGRYLKNLLSELYRLDKENEYVVFGRQDDKEKLEKQFSRANWKVVTTDIHWHTIREQVTFSSLLEKEQVDLMHFPYFSLPIRYTKPFVVTIHDLIIHQFATGKASTLPLPLYQLKRLGYRHVLMHALRHAKRIIVPLDAVKRDITRIFSLPGERIVVTKEGFDRNIQVKDTASDIKDKMGGSQYFLYVGNAYPHKNVKKLLDAFKSFGDNTISLCLVGKKDYFYDQLVQYVKTQNIQRIQFLHTVSDSDLAYLYEHAVALVSPSLMEGFGLTPLEALALGCPVVVSDIPAFREVCQEHAMYFDPNDTQSIAKALRDVSTVSKEKREKIIQDGKKRVSDFSWEKLAKETIAIYESCISV